MRFLWPREEHRRHRSWVEDFTDQCLLWRLSSRKTIFAPELGIPTNLGWGDLVFFQLPRSNSSPEGA